MKENSWKYRLIYEKDNQSFIDDPKIDNRIKAYI